MSLLRAGMSELDTAAQVKDIPRFFVRLAGRTGLRLLLLKRWRTGLQVYHQEGIELPKLALERLPDGKAPIPVEKGNLFDAVARDRVVYAGPVPVKHFPLDLTLMLGRGSKDRQIVVLPLPAGKHWNTFLYLDADRTAEQILSVAEVLAEFAILRMRLLCNGEIPSGKAVAAIRREELSRRQARQARHVEGMVREETLTAPPEAAIAESESGAEGPDVDDEDGFEAGLQADSDAPLTPEGVLRHSGELPALPRAAVHIMSVIDDPRTTATKLEKAIAMDQALTAKVLRIANSPFYGAVRDIRTVSDAIVRLGFVTIRNWTLVAATKSIFLTPGAGILYQRIWRQSILSAMSSQLVAQAIRHDEPETIFVGGLMQNIGQLVLARSLPELFQEVLSESAGSGRPYYEVERELLGFDHGELGALLLREWNLSVTLEEAVHYHHRLDEENGQWREAAMIALGEEIGACNSGGEEEDRLEWENSDAAGLLDVDADLYTKLADQARELKIDPLFYS